MPGDCHCVSDAAFFGCGVNSHCDRLHVPVDNELLLLLSDGFAVLGRHHPHGCRASPGRRRSRQSVLRDKLSVRVGGARSDRQSVVEHLHTRTRHAINNGTMNALGDHDVHLDAEGLGIPDRLGRTISRHDRKRSPAGRHEQAHRRGRSRTAATGRRPGVVGCGDVFGHRGDTVGVDAGVRVGHHGDDLLGGRPQKRLLLAGEKTAIAGIATVFHQ